MKYCNHCLEPSVPIEIDGTLLDYCENCGLIEGETHEEEIIIIKEL